MTIPPFQGWTTHLGDRSGYRFRRLFTHESSFEVVIHRRRHSKEACIGASASTRHIIHLGHEHRYLLHKHPPEILDTEGHIAIVVLVLVTGAIYFPHTIILSIGYDNPTLPDSTLWYNTTISISRFQVAGHMHGVSLNTSELQITLHLWHWILSQVHKKSISRIYFNYCPSLSIISHSYLYLSIPPVWHIITDLSLHSTLPVYTDQPLS